MAVGAEKKKSSSMAWSAATTKNQVEEDEDREKARKNQQAGRQANEQTNKPTPRRSRRIAATRRKTLSTKKFNMKKVVIKMTNQEM